MKNLTWATALLIITTISIVAAENNSPLTGMVASIDGKPVDLASYKGNVVLIVNVASRCGFTKQYKELQETYAKYADQGFTVLGFPCNQFGKQEPGTDAEIWEFCQNKFSVTFPMFSKVDVNGENAIPLYKYLTSNKTPVKDQGKVRWNFEKFLLDSNGKLIGRYRSKVKPTDTTLTKAIEAALASKKKAEAGN